jgi:hypothetical protein
MLSNERVSRTNFSNGLNRKGSGGGIAREDGTMYILGVARKDDTT